MDKSAWRTKLLDKIEKAKMDKKNKDYHNSLFAVLSLREMEQHRVPRDTSQPISNLIVKAPEKLTSRQVQWGTTLTYISPDPKVKKEAWDFALRKPGLPDCKEAALIREMKALTTDSTMKLLRHQKDIPNSPASLRHPSK